MNKVEEKISVENINIPGRSAQVNAEKYKAARAAFLKILPTNEPGLTQKEIQQTIVKFLPDDLFPGGSTFGWWAKTVQLDLEAKGVVVREKSKPLRWHKLED